MNKTLSYIAAAAAGVALFSACDDDFARPPMVLPATVEVEANYTIDQIKNRYWSGMGTAQVVDLDQATGDSIIFKGRVCSSDASGNIFKRIYVQSVNDKGQQISIAFAVNAKDIYKQFPFGQEVAVWATGLNIGSASGVLAFGDPSDKDFYMTEETFYAHIVRTGTGLPEPQKVDTTATTLAHIKDIKGVSDSLKVWQSRLVRINEVHWVEAGKPYSDQQYGTNRYIADAEGNTLMVRNSTFTNYSTEALPYGTGSVVGILSQFNSDLQLTLIDQEGCIDFDGVAPEPGPEVDPAGEGTAADPYNVSKAYDIVTAMAADTESAEVYVSGVISAIKSVALDYGNAEYTITDEGGSKSLGVYRGKWLGGAKFTAENQIEVGAKVVIKGKLVNYKGNTPQLAANNELVSYNGETAGGTTPSEPTDPTGTPAGDGTEASPYNVAKALAVTKALAADVESAEVYVAGNIALVKEVSTSFGNATYYIADEGSSEQFYVYRGKWLGGEKFTAEDQLKVGAKVVIKGKLVNYKGNSPQLAQNNEIVSYDGETAGGGNEEPGEQPGEPATPGDAVNINLTPFKGEARSTGFAVISPVTTDGYTFTTSKASGSSDPGYYEYVNDGVTEGTIRLYANNTLNIKGSAAIAKIVFTINTATGAKRYAPFAPSSGSVAEQKEGDASITWTGNASDLTFTVGATSIGTEAGKPGQVHISKIEIYPAK